MNYDSSWIDINCLAGLSAVIFTFDQRENPMSAAGKNIDLSETVIRKRLMKQYCALCILFSRR